MKIGDRIKYIGYEDANMPYYPKYGTGGVIVSIESNEEIAMVLWDENSLIDGCDGFPWSVPMKDIAI